MPNRMKSAVIAVAVGVLGASGQSYAGQTITEITVANGQKRFQKVVTQIVYQKVCLDQFLQGEVVTADASPFDTGESGESVSARLGGGEPTVNALPGGPCLEWTIESRTAVVAATLHETRQDAENGVRYFAATPDNDTAYKGCGIAAAQKFLAFYGVHKTQEEIKRVIPSYPFGSQIAVLPADLRNGVEHFLRQAGLGGEIRMRNWLDAMSARSAIGLGLHVRAAPTIVLVNNGSHYVVAFGWRGGEKYYNGPYDVMSNHVAESHSTLDTQFYAGGIWGAFGAIFSQAYGYTPGTLISVY